MSTEGVAHDLPALPPNLRLDSSLAFPYPEHAPGVVDGLFANNGPDVRCVKYLLLGHCNLEFIPGSAQRRDTRTLGVLSHCLRVYWAYLYHYYIGLEGQEKVKQAMITKAQKTHSKVIIPEINLDLLSWVKRGET